MASFPPPPPPPPTVCSRSITTCRLYVLIRSDSRMLPTCMKVWGHTQMHEGFDTHNCITVWTNN